jgi:hypothetical protein
VEGNSPCSEPITRTNAEIRTLIREMARDNVGWGAPRIHGELLKLGFVVSEATVSRLISRRFPPPSQTWGTFLTNHLPRAAAIDFFVVPTATCRSLYVFVVIAHERRSTATTCCATAPPIAISEPSTSGAATTPASSPGSPAACSTSATRLPSNPPSEGVGGASYLVAAVRASRRPTSPSASPGRSSSSSSGRSSTPRCRRPPSTRRHRSGRAARGAAA